MRWVVTALVVIVACAWLVRGSQQAEELIARGGRELRARRVQQADQSFRRAAHLSPDAGTLARVGLEYLSAGQLRSSLPYFEKAVALRPRQPWAVLTGLAAARAASGRLAEAERQMEQLIRTMPDDALVLNNVGYGMADAAVLVDQATVILEKAVRLAPNDPIIADSLGWAYYRQGRLRAALGLLEGAARRTDNAEIRGHLLEVRRALRSGTKEEPP